MIRLRDLPPDLHVDLESLKCLPVSEPVAALLATLTKARCCEIDVRLVRTNQFGTKGTNVIFTKGYDNSMVCILDEHDGKFSFTYHKKSFEYALEQLK